MQKTILLSFALPFLSIVFGTYFSPLFAENPVAMTFNDPSASIAYMNANMTEENELHPYVPFDELPENIKLILNEYVSPPTLELIKSGRPPNEEMLRAGVRRESFFGDIYPVYHEFGAVYIFNGSGSIVHVNGGVDGVEAPEGVITVAFSWSTEFLESTIGLPGPPPSPATTPTFPTTLIVAITIIVAIAVVGAAILVYFTKVKKTNHTCELLYVTCYPRL